MGRRRVQVGWTPGVRDGIGVQRYEVIRGSRGQRLREFRCGVGFNGVGSIGFGGGMGEGRE